MWNQFSTKQNKKSETNDSVRIICLFRLNLKFITLFYREKEKDSTKIHI